MPQDIEVRLLRAFAAVADELHFTRAAARLHLAQQALSRDVRRLERQLDRALFVRTTRSVELTPEGERLLPHVRATLAAHDELAAACRRQARPLLVDTGADVGTAHRVLLHARRLAPGVELTARHHSGLTGAAHEIAAGRLDVSFGRLAGLPPRLRTHLDHQPVRYEPMAVLLPEDHPLAARPRLTPDDLAGATLYAADGNPHTAEWTDLARLLFDRHGVVMAEPFPEIDGDAEFVRVVRERGWAVLASVEFLRVPQMVLRPLHAPVPLSAVSMVWRRGTRHPGLTALHTAARELGGREGWLTVPADHWLPEADRLVMAPGQGRDDAPPRSAAPPR
ncbi:LysR family transcriptional regulator [Streptomyces sp. NPDC059740]|uniref:LysR family transcriptional regulator n=1 Tax=Streptomyces sp. NPDC059740 TaxID=3346926 RepID=UPI00364DE64A